MSNEGSYDAPLEQIAPNTLDSEMPRASVLAAERQARINRAKQRRSEMAQNPASVSSALSSSGTPTPVKIPDTSSASLASNNAALRTELVKEAVDFLNNPRVAGKPLVSKRNFLIQRKGLTEAEVDEAVRRSNPGTTLWSSFCHIFVFWTFLTLLGKIRWRSSRRIGTDGTHGATKDDRTPTTVLWSAGNVSTNATPCCGLSFSQINCIGGSIVRGCCGYSNASVQEVCVGVLVPSQKST